MTCSDFSALQENPQGFWRNLAEFWKKYNGFGRSLSRRWIALCAQQALAVGFQLHVAKPIESNQLIEAIVSLTHRSQSGGMGSLL
ncbi:hypothetical protein [Pseudanabaena sp. FACHB-2040]|uniref:hypothetical protein n=1 Tax=Pseudanabaena sp. FACHB-2040 TaxID=2692859 RepID=UPI001683507D|nr:hypothetical protein [Pseudanabaena sp. FACHB-2040]MBD2256519.1 hypothetical protein [Pseudanabaena sp. FACHB-2040]